MRENERKIKTSSRGGGNELQIAATLELRVIKKSKTRAGRANGVYTSSGGDEKKMPSQIHKLGQAHNFFAAC